jgi:hypothetical protein
MKAGSSVAGDLDSFVHHGAQAALVDVAHGEGAHPGFANVRGFELIDIPHAYQRYVCATTLGE